MRLLSTPTTNEDVLSVVWEKVSAFVSGESASHPIQALPRLLDEVSCGRTFTAEEEETYDAIINGLQQISVMTAEFHSRLKSLRQTVEQAA
jgi:hypothetical protein